MNVAVLGGAGYIGSHTVKKLLDAGYSVTVIDNLRTGHIEAVDARASFKKGDMRDEEFLKRVFSETRFDAVMHFAASSLVGESMEKPLEYYDNNVGGAISLIKAMVATDTDKIIFSSTAAVYGEPREIPISESSPTEPKNTYGETKLVMENIFRRMSDIGKMRFASLRYFNACGADESGRLGEAHNPETHLIPNVLAVANGNAREVSVFGGTYDTPDGTCIRDYIHVSDLADAHILALSYLQKGGKSDIFNLGNGAGFSVSEVIESARRVTGCEIPQNIVSKRAGDPARLVASSEKAKKILGWTPLYTELDEIVGSAWIWHKLHPKGYEK